MSIYINYELDELDWSILEELQKDARLTFAEIGRRVNLSAPSVAERIQKMKDADIINGYAVSLNLNRLGLPVMAFIRMSLNGLKAEKVIEKAKKVSEVLECHRATGSDCVIMKVRVSSIEKLENLTDKFTSFGQLTTSVVLSTSFEQKVIDQEMVN